MANAKPVKAGTGKSPTSRKSVTGQAPPRRPRQARSPGIERDLDRELAATFPASDPLAMTQPGAGITGPEVTPVDPADWDEEIADRETGGRRPTPEHHR